ncbi:MAG: tetratricopeptide repeat protein [Candidatus Thorarchaeota archaeon]
MMRFQKGRSSEDLDDLFERAVSLLRNKEYEDSIRLLRKLVKHRPRDESTWSSLILALLGAERWDEAREAHRKLKPLLVDDGLPPFTGPGETVIRYARMLDSDGEDKLAEEIYILLTQMMPQDKQNLIRLAQFYSSRGRPNEAKAVLQKGNFDAEELWTRLGTLFWERSDFEKAIEARRNATLAAPGSLEAWMNLAIDNYRSGNYIEGKKALEKAREISKDDPESRRKIDNLVQFLQANRENLKELHGREPEL